MSHQNSLLGSKSEVISHSPLPAATLNENKNSSYNVPDTPTLIPDSEPEILEPIAIVGLSLKFPQNASNPEAFWKMMEEKRCAMTEWPIDRLNIDAFYDPEKNKGCNIYARGGNFMAENLAAFDTSFFSITAEEAKAMDPQHRLLLETTYRAFENAGIPLEKAFGSNTGVYTGSMADDYRFTSLGDKEHIPKYSVTGVSMSLLANRLSWFFNLHGPSVNLDAACSSSLMALDIACQGLQSRASSMAVVAGTSLIHTLETWIMLSNMGFLSPDSRCYSFDSRANGYARGEGLGVVIVKRLSDAIRDDDTIRAVIRSTASNSDGHTPGITQPSKDAQERLVRETYAKAGLDLGTTRFFESHGTGTVIGDPIEADAIGRVFKARRTAAEPLYVGAVKSNIGHLEGGSGIAGLIKTILVLEKGLIPPNANFEETNPNIDTEFLNIKFPTELTPWPSHGLRRASVNSFGFGGSNSHCIIDDAYHFLEARSLVANHSTVKEPVILPEPFTNGSDTVGSQAHSYRVVNGFSTKLDKPNVPQLLVLSASDEDGIKRLAESYTQYFRDISSDTNKFQPELEDLAYTLACRRTSLAWKAFAVVSSVDELQDIKRIISRPRRSGKGLSAAFVFTGQGAQYHEMGIKLMQFPAFRKTLDQANAALKELGCTWSISEELSRRQEDSNVHNPAFSQPLCTALQVALIELWRSFGIIPSVVLGHSSGEIAAAYATGGLSLKSACKVAFFRGFVAGKLKDSLSSTPGAMLSVNIPEYDVRPYLEKIECLSDPDCITVACINSPLNVTLSGNQEDLELIQAHMERDGIFARTLKTGLPYHSPRMMQVSSAYLDLISDLDRGSEYPKTPTMFSSVTGMPLLDNKVLTTGEYWVKNMVQPVKFFQALSSLLSRSKFAGKAKLGKGKTQVAINDLIEVGPHSALNRPILDTHHSLNLTHDVRYHSTLSRNEPEIKSILELAGKLNSLGYKLDFAEVNQKISPGRIAKSLTTLPEYPFNHSREYWHEPRATKEIRFRPHGPLELLGTAMSDWNPLEGRWRKVFDTSKSPWIEDHKVNGKIIYPAAGMIVMVVEAAKQTAAKNRVITGFRFEDVWVSHPIAIEDQGGQTETQLYMKPLQNNFDKDCPSSLFRICVLDRGQWNEVGRGTVRVEYAKNVSEVDGGFEEKAVHEHFREQLRSSTQQSDTTVSKERLYQCFRDMGLDLGKSFQALQNIQYDGHHDAVAEINTQNWQTYNSSSAIQPHTIHPTTLDAAVQLSWVILTKGCTGKIPTTIPTRIKTAWISSSGLDSNVLQLHCTARFKSPQKAEISSFVLDAEGKVRLSISNLESTTVSSNKGPSDRGPTQLCYYMDLKPDVELLKVEKLLSMCHSNSKLEKEPSNLFDQLDLVSFFFNQKALGEIQESAIKGAKPYFQKYIQCMKRQVEKFHAGEILSRDPAWTAQLQDASFMETLIREIEGTILGKAHVAIGRRLPDIIEGRIEPLELLFSSDNLAEDYYHEICHRGSYCKEIGNYLDLLSHKNPGMKILEVGAGKGSFTDILLPVLLHHSDVQGGTERFSTYDYTDISESFFENAQEKYAPKTARIRFKTLNIEKDPVSQGFDEGTYDLILAHCVLHATSNLAHSIQNCRKLLKPGGKLIMLEITRPELMRCGFVFGILPGWWLSTESFRKWSPGISEVLWDTQLKQNGFSGNDFSIKDYDNSTFHEFSIIVSTATTKNLALKHPETKFIVVSDTQDPLQNAIISHFIKNEHLDVQAIALSDILAVEVTSSTVFVFLQEIGKPFLYDMDAPTFELLKAVLNHAQRLLWVTHGPIGTHASPKVRLIDGFARVLRSEMNSRTLVTLDFQDQQEPAEYATKIIEMCEKIVFEKEDKNHDLEYNYRDGAWNIGRIIEAKELDRKLHHSVSPEVSEKLVKEVGAVSLTIATPGLLDSLFFESDDTYSNDLPPGEIEIKVQYLGLNFRDLVVALGRHPDTTFGCECSGIISRVGNYCGELKVGDRVCATKIGCMSTFVRCSTELVFKIPTKISSDIAAGTLIAGSTVYHSLVRNANLERGESVLIHSASGGTGQLAIQLAKHLGCEIFVTVGFNSKKALLAAKYDIPEDHIFYSRDLSFAAGIKRMTNGRGVDCVLNSLSGDGLVASWEVIAPYGRFIELGKVDIAENSKLPMAPFEKNATFSAVAIDDLIKERPKAFRKTMLQVMELLDKGVLHVAEPLQVMPVSNMQEGMRLMQSGKLSGKIVFSVDEEDKIPTLLHSLSTWKFDPEATYLIAGGFGGLGRSTALWMAKKGAKNLILLSRSGPKAKTAIQLLEKLKELKVRVWAPKCDVSLAEELSNVLNDCSKELAPIKGCIQCSMALQDALFDKMTFQEWSMTISSKVQSSWNLHKSLPSDLSFFIMLSSIAGVGGSIGQANYAAGNTFQDALSLHRISLGQMAVSLRLGIMGDVGIVSEKDEYFKNQRKLVDMAKVKEVEYLALLDHYCDPNLGTLSPRESLPIIGLVTPSQLRTQNLEIPYWLKGSAFSPLAQIGTSTNAWDHSKTGTIDFGAQLRSASSLEDARKSVLAAIVSKLSSALAISKSEIDESRPLHAYGVDSLLAVELRNWFGKELGLDVAVFDIMGADSFTSISELVVARSSPVTMET